MGIKTTIQRKIGKSKYPCLKEGDNGVIVLLFAKEEGIAVKGSRHNSIGEYSDNWAEHTFKLFDGTVTLEND